MMQLRFPEFRVPPILKLLHNKHLYIKSTFSKKKQPDTDSDNFNILESLNITS